jgi:xanthine dehydrogenase accessory factor
MSGPLGGTVREVVPDLVAALDRGEPAAVATVVRTWRSAPRPPGAAMVVLAGGEAVGSVSGGCVEGALYEVGGQVLADGQPQYQSYGVSDDDAFAVGLTCGGIIDVFVEPVSEATWPELRRLAADIEAGEPVAVATVFRGEGPVGRHLVVRPGGVEGSLGDDYLDQVVADEARGMLESGATGTIYVGTEGRRLAEELEVFVASYAPPPRLVIFGAIDFAAALARVGKLMGFYVVVCDARPVFATRRRFPDADEVIVDWPHRWLGTQDIDARTVICVLTHDTKFDVPALEVALRTKARYVGALGSRRTHSDRLARLKEAGLTEDELARLHSPIGLDLGARTPEETAISIAAEIVKDRWGGTGTALAHAQGPIHPDVPR